MSSSCPPPASGNAFYLVLASAPFFGLLLPVLLLNDLQALLLTIPFLVMVVYKTVYFVKPAERAIIVDMLTGAPRVLESGLHLIWNPSYYRKPLNGSSWAKFEKFPEVGTRVHIDPRPTQVHTMDGIPTTADVSLECLVRDWSAASIMKDGGCIHSRACTTVNQWLSEQLTHLSADKCTYGNLNVFLNTAERLDSLNAMLASGFSYLTAQRVVIDANGILMSKAWLDQRDQINLNRQLLSEREVAINRTNQIKILEIEYEISAERLRVEHETAIIKLRAQAETDSQSARAVSELESIKLRTEYEDTREANRMRNGLEQGLSTEQYCKIAIAKVLFETMAQSEGTKYLALPPGMLGLGSNIIE